MVWTRRLTRTAVIFLVVITVLADQSDAEIQTVWFPVFNPERGGQVDVLVSDGDRLYASPGRGLVFSDDSGITWNPTGFKDYVTAIAAHGNTIYVGAHRARGIFRSDDRGETWKPINNGLRMFKDSEGRSIYGFVYQILVTRSGTVIALLDRRAAYISDDRGETWRDLTLEWDYPPFDPLVRSYHFSYSNSRLLEFDGYLWAWRTTIGRSSDNGRTWQFAAGRYHPFNGIDAWVVHNDRLYLAGGGYRTGPGVGVPAKTPYFARFDDEFRQPLVQGLPLHPKYDPYANFLHEHVSDVGYALIRTLASHRGRIFAGMWGFGVYVFNDRSETWSPAGLNGLIVFSLVVHQSDLYAATDKPRRNPSHNPPRQSPHHLGRNQTEMKHLTFTAALFFVISLARADWEPLLGTQAMRTVRALETDGRRLFVGATLEGLYTSDDNGETWSTTHLSVGYAPAIAVSGDVVYASMHEHGMFRSDDYGATWNPINNGLHTIHDHTLEIRIPYINQILVTRSDMVIAVGGFHGTYISRDRGETWRFPADWFFPCPKAPEVPDFTFSDSIDSMIEYDGYLWAASWFYIYRSPDDGSIWECVPRLPRLGEAYDWAVLNNRLYVAGGHGFVRWNEGELAWDDLNKGLPDYPDLRSLAVYRGRIFAAVRASSVIRPGAYRTVAHGVYVFDEQSETWLPAGLDGVAVFLVASDQSYLYASTYKGIYRASIPVVLSYGKSATTWGAIKRQ